MNNIEKSQLEEADFQPEKMKRLPRGAFLVKPGDTPDPCRTKIRAILYSVIDHNALLQSQTFIAVVAEKAQEYQGDR